MEFRTQIPILKSKHPIDYDATVLSLGSCFAVNMGNKFDYFQFKNSVNPFGILFHPIALENYVVFAIRERTFTQEDVFFHNERWQSFDVHSELSHSDKNQLLTNLNAITKRSNRQIEQATHIIITLGTAWVYRNIATHSVVANCHKVPSNQFSKELLSVGEIKKSLDNMLSLLYSANSKARIIFTISPVRHIKDGFVENQWSKANLIAALHEIVINQPAAEYFPSYEIMMDELRDYRYYESDMIHPNQVAVDYIWHQFSEHYIAKDAKKVMIEIDAIRKALAHKPFQVDSTQHQNFLQKIKFRMASLQQLHSHIQF